jgi:hypothetical protein
MHGGKAETVRKSRALADLVRSTDETKARRDFCDSTRNRVLAAAEQHVEAKHRRVALAPPSGNDERPMTLAPTGGALSQAGNQASTSVEGMMQQRKALLDAGLEAEAEKVQARLTQIRSDAARERVELEQRLVRQRLTALEYEQSEHLEQQAKTQAEQREKAEAAWRDEACTHGSNCAADGV